MFFFSFCLFKVFVCMWVSVCQFTSFYNGIKISCKKVCVSQNRSLKKYVCVFVSKCVCVYMCVYVCICVSVLFNVWNQYLCTHWRQQLLVFLQNTHTLTYKQTHTHEHSINTPCTFTSSFECPPFLPPSLFFLPHAVFVFITTSLTYHFQVHIQN